MTQEHVLDQNAFQDEKIIGMINEDHAKLILGRIIKNNLIPHSCMMETAIASNYSIEEVIQGLESKLQTEWLRMHVDGLSNVCLII